MIASVIYLAHRIVFERLSLFVKSGLQNMIVQCHVRLARWILGRLRVLLPGDWWRRRWMKRTVVWHWQVSFRHRAKSVEELKFRLINPKSYGGFKLTRRAPGQVPPMFPKEARGTSREEATLILLYWFCAHYSRVSLVNTSRGQFNCIANAKSSDAVKFYGTRGRKNWNTLSVENCETLVEQA